MTQFEGLEDFPYLLKARMNSFIATSFDDSMTVEMQLRVLIEWIKKTISLTNSQTDYLNTFIEKFDDKLYKTADDVLHSWVESGLFDDLLNKGELADIRNILATKVDETIVNAKLAQNTKQTKIQSFLFEPKTGIIAHRGATKNAPENTVKSIYEAGRLGYAMVELDVQRTTDGVYMLMHDATVDRTTNSTGPFNVLSFDEAKNLIVDVDYLGKIADEVVRIPTFEEACRECQKWGLGINVDGSKMGWTASDFHEICGLLKKYGLWERSFFVVSDYNERVTLTGLYPDANVTWLSYDTDPTYNIAECKNYLNAFVSYPSSLITDDLITAYRANDIPIFVYSCSTTNVLYKYFTKGVRFVETDFVLPKGEV